MAFHLDFVVVGPQRTGTSWLEGALRAHPRIALPERVKETYFFEQYFDRGIDWYASHFPTELTDRRVGETAPTVFDIPEGPGRVHALSPKCRAVITLREPKARAVSLYRHHLNKGRVSGSFTEAVRAMPRILDAGRYAQHVPRWLDELGAENVHFVLLDDIEAHPETVWAGICAFLGVEQLPLPELPDEQKGSMKRSPRYPLLAKVAARAASELRARGLHAVVEAGKRAGIRRAVFSGQAPSRGITADEKRNLADLYARDIEYVRSLTGRPLEAWNELQLEGGA
jgi:hypothetical protein